MKQSTVIQVLTGTAIATTMVALMATSAHAATNAEAATALAKKSDCLKCHAIDKDKKAASFKKIAASWRGKPDAEAKLMDAITKAPKVKMKDGTEEEHKIIGTKDPVELKNLVGWILSL